MSNLYVSGSYLVWGQRPYNPIGSGSYRFLGGISSDYPGQPAGRVWVSPENRHLYYSDSGSVTRIITGVLVGSGSSPDGRVYMNLCSCPTSSTEMYEQLVWSYNNKQYGAQGENQLGCRRHETASLGFLPSTTLPGYTQGDGFFYITMTTSSAGLSPVCDTITVGRSNDASPQFRTFMLVYSASNCQGPTQSVQWPTALTLPVSAPYVNSNPWYATASFNKSAVAPYTASYRIVTGVLSFGTANTNRSDQVTGSSFCLTGSNDYIRFAPIGWSTCQDWPT